VLARKGRFIVAEPFFAVAADARGPLSSRGRGQLVIAPARGRGSVQARVGDLVLLRAARQGHKGPARAQVARVIGRPDVARDVIEALMIERGLHRGFGAKLQREAEAATAAAERGGLAVADHGEAASGPARLDLRDLSTFTVDPATARDYDDAISAQVLDGEVVRVWVHIADVSAYVREGSVLDKEARRRGTSVYVPGTVEPMLPEALSNDACSLGPGQDRLAVTVEMDIDGGEVGRVAFHRTLIRSDARLNYDQVDEIFAGREQARQGWGAGLHAARAAAAGLGRTRRRSGALEVDSVEPTFAFDADGAVSVTLDSGTAAQATESHQMIEQLMIAANEAVASHLSDRGVPCLYRVHERPEPRRVLHLVDQLVSLGIPTPPVPDPMSESEAAELVAAISVGVGRYFTELESRAAKETDTASGGRIALTGLVLRTLQQAYYSPRNLGHAGLGSAAYCHFTSPIRRYPDIVCHRALLSTLGAGERAADAAALGELGAWTSEREREAMSIERDAVDVARCFALEGLLRERGSEHEFPGEITGLIGGGAFVAFGGGHDEGFAAVFEGMIPVRRLRWAPTAPAAAPAPAAAGTGRTANARPAQRAGAAGRGRGGDRGADRSGRRDGSQGGGRDWWELNEEGTILYASESGRTLRLGEAVSVRVAKVEPARGRVELAPAGNG
jgi:ribonuclease R